jgi:hypothetical protein
MRETFSFQGVSSIQETVPLSCWGKAFSSGRLHKGGREGKSGKTFDIGYSIALPLE